MPPSRNLRQTVPMLRRRVLPTQAIAQRRQQRVRPLLRPPRPLHRPRRARPKLLLLRRMALHLRLHSLPLPRVVPLQLCRCLRRRHAPALDTAGLHLRLASGSLARRTLRIHRRPQHPHQGEARGDSLAVHSEPKQAQAIDRRRTSLNNNATPTAVSTKRTVLTAVF